MKPIATLTIDESLQVTVASGPAGRHFGGRRLDHVIHWSARVRVLRKLRSALLRRRVVCAGQVPVWVEHRWQLSRLHMAAMRPLAGAPIGLLNVYLEKRGRIGGAVEPRSADPVAALVPLLCALDESTLSAIRAALEQHVYDAAKHRVLFRRREQVMER